MLDTPEVIDAWIAERKKRFPTSERVTEKKRKMDEALARGQLDLNARPNKRHRLGEQSEGGKRGRGGHQQRGRGPRGTNYQEMAASSSSHKPREVAPLPPKPMQPAPEVTKAQRTNDSTDSSGDEDGVPEELSSKPLNVTKASLVAETAQLPRPTHKSRRVTQPRAPPKNPFNARPTLLRNVSLALHPVNYSNDFLAASSPRHSNDRLKPFPSDPFHCR